MKRTFFLASFSAFFISLSQANPFFLQGVPHLIFVSLVPLFIAWIKSTSFRQTLIASLSYAFFATLLQCYWLAYFGDFSLFTLGGTIVGYLIYFAIYSIFIWYLLQSTLPYKFFLLAASWTFYEVTKSTGFLAYPWGLLAHPLHSCLTLVQIVDLIGVFGLGFFVALSNSLIAFVILKKNNTSLKKLSLLTIAIFTCFHLYGRCILATRSLPEKTLAVLLVQPNEDPWGENEEDALQTSLELSLKAFQEHPQTQLIIWSETLLKRQYFHCLYSYIPSDKPLHKVLSSLPVNWLIGAPSYRKDIVPSLNWQEFNRSLWLHPFWKDKTKHPTPQNLKELWIHFPFWEDLYELSNSALLLSPTGEILQSYSKRQLVPFAENIPFLNIPFFKYFYNSIGLSSQWAPGKETGLFKLTSAEGETYTLGILICFEDAFDLLARQEVQEGAQVLINLSNDSWSKTASAEWQHHIVAKFRAIENKKTLIRATNGGLTSIIDPWGHELAQLPVFQACFLSFKAPIYTNAPTLFTLWGDWFLYILGASFIAIILFSQKYELKDKD